MGEVGGLHTKRYRESFDAFVKGGEAEAKNMFQSGGEPVHCLSTRFEGVNYRVSMLIVGPRTARSDKKKNIEKALCHWAF